MWNFGIVWKKLWQNCFIFKTEIITLRFHENVQTLESLYTVAKRSCVHFMLYCMQFILVLKNVKTLSFYLNSDVWCGYGCGQNWLTLLPIPLLKIYTNNKNKSTTMLQTKTNFESDFSLSLSFTVIWSMSRLDQIALPKDFTILLTKYKLRLELKPNSIVVFYKLVGWTIESGRYWYIFTFSCVHWK